MDSFVQQMLDRTRARQQQLLRQVSAGTESAIRKRRSPLKEDNAILTLQPETSDVKQKIEVNPTKRQCVVEPEVSEDIVESENENFKTTTIVSYRQSPAKDVRGRSGSSKSPAEELQFQRDVDHRRARFQALANTINQWEDQVYTTENPSANQVHSTTTTRPPIHPNSRSRKESVDRPISVIEPKAPLSTVVRSRSPSPSNAKVVGATTKRIVWDQSLIKALVSDNKESQGFRSSGSASRLIYEFEERIRSRSPSPTGSVSSTPPPVFHDTPTKVNITPNKVIITPTKVNITPTKVIVLTQVTPSPTKVEITPSKVSTVPSSMSPVKMCATPPSKIMATPPNGNRQRSPSPCRSTMGTVIAERKAHFENEMQDAYSSGSFVDPALLPLSERMALFERKGSQVLVPKAPITSPIVPSKVQHMIKAKDNTAVVEPPKSPSKVGNNTVEAQRRLFERMSDWRQSEVVKDAKEQRLKELAIVLGRFDKYKDESSNPQPRSQINPYPQPIQYLPMPIFYPPPPAMVIPQQISAVDRNDYDLVQSASPPWNSSSCSSVSPPRGKKDYPGLKNEHRITLSPPKSGRLYPSVSDLEATETETETVCSSNPASSDDESIDATDYHEDTSLLSFGAHILQAATSTVDNRGIQTGVSRSEESRLIRDLLDAALEGELSSSTMTTPSPPTPPHARRSPMRKSSPRKVAPSPVHNYVSPPSTYQTPRVDASIDNTPLSHTVSMYRRQKPQDVDVTPLRQIFRNTIGALSPGDTVTEEVVDDDNEQPEVPLHQQIKILQEEAMLQQNVICQASNALGLCQTQPQFTGSPEEVEAERLLLVAGHRRTTALNEIQRLKSEACLRKGSGLMGGKGSLSLSGISLPLSKEFLIKMGRGGDGQVYHFLILLRYRSQLIPTQLVSVGGKSGVVGKADTVASGSASPMNYLKAGAITFPNLIQLQGLEASFTVSLEVYMLTTKCREGMVAKRSKKDFGSLLTPKRSKGIVDGRGPCQSPAPIPNNKPIASSFKLVGNLALSLPTLHHRNWALTKLSPGCPLDGTVNLHLSCHAESCVCERGFLTLFDDVGGLGSWHRRWALLDGNTLAFWTYPDDEGKKDPLVLIDLGQCVTASVGTVSRDVCARLHTFLLETIRPLKPGDKNTLVVNIKGEWARSRNLISADTKEERMEWCNKLNQALINIRSWNPNALRPGGIQ